jgi:hypothetical protein
MANHPVTAKIPLVTYHDLNRKLSEDPFKPFRIRMSNTTNIDVRRPVPFILGESSAVIPTDTITDERGYTVARDWKTISIGHIVEFVELNEKKRKRI